MLRAREHICRFICARQHICRFICAREHIDKIGFGNESILGYEWIIKMRVCELVAGVIIYFLRNLIVNKVCFIVVLASLLFSFFVEYIIISTYVFKRCKKTNRNIDPFITYICLLICNILITLFFNIKV